MIGAAIVDNDLDGLASLLVGDLENGAERQRPVCGCHGVLIELLARGRRFAIEAGAVPRGTPALVLGLNGGDRRQKSDQYRCDRNAFPMQPSNYSRLLRRAREAVRMWHNYEPKMNDPTRNGTVAILHQRWNRESSTGISLLG